jgi:long-subunit acyl-CoA synthetase (AMP-forming)
MQRAAVVTEPSKRGLRAPTVALAFTQTVRAAGDRIALRTRGGEREITWAEYGEQVDRFALGLREQCVAAGDVVALMLSNRPEFHIADTACISLGATPFSLYATLTPEQIA